MGETKPALTIEVGIRERNRRLTLALVRALVPLSWVVPGRLIVWLGNLILRLYRIEYRVGRGPWHRCESNLTMESGGVIPGDYQ